MGSVHLDRVTKRYPSERRSRVALGALLPKYVHQGNSALQEIDLTISPGEILGIIGPNGAGKSTLLRLLAGITEPSVGSVHVYGSVASMIELGLGFHPELTGWENINCSAALLGLDRTRRRQRAGEIADFSGVAGSLDRPLRTFSAGMAARLGFAVATHVDADILVVDEVLAVGDREFQEQCVKRMLALNAAGRTVVVVSHEMPLVALTCKRSIQLREGRIVDEGPTNEVVERYLTTAQSRHRRSPDPPAVISSCELDQTAIEPWDPIGVSIDVEVRDASRRLGVGIDLVYPTLDPNHVFFSDFARLPRLDRGEHKLHGRSDPYPGTTGRVRVIASVVDESAQRLADGAECDFTINSDQIGTRPLLAVEPAWTVTPVESAGRRDEAVELHVEKDPIARMRGVKKAFPAGDTSSIRSAVPGPWPRWLPTSRIEALRGVDLDIGQGSTLGIIGPNGAGKSTVLRILAGVTDCDRGLLEIKGRVIPVLDLGLGFRPELAGLENARISLKLLGLGRQERVNALSAAVEFAELDEALVQPVRTYSSGTVARLGFALASHADPDLLLLDETLAVGDERFRHKAMQRVRELSERGTAVVFVSHDMALVEAVCKRVVLLDGGRVMADGPAAKVVERHSGHGWAGGRSGHAGVRLDHLELERHHIPAGDSLTMTGELQVLERSPHVRIELSFRALSDGTPPADLNEARSRTIYEATVEDSNGITNHPGTYRFRADVDRVAIEGEIEVVVAAIDERDGLTVSECWRAATIGRPPDSGVVGPHLDFSWTVDAKSL